MGKYRKQFWHCHDQKERGNFIRINVTRVMIRKTQINEYLLLDELQPKIMFWLTPSVFYWDICLLSLIFFCLETAYYSLRSFLLSILNYLKQIKSLDFSPALKLSSLALFTFSVTHEQNYCCLIIFSFLNPYL